MVVKKRSKKSHAHLFFIPMVIIGIALFGGYFVANGGAEWYQTIQKPPWTPPNQVFTWAVFVTYALSGYSAVMVWEVFPRDSRFKTINLLFGVYAFLYMLYTYFFFGSQEIASAVLVAILLELTIILLCVLLWKHSKRAAIALFPVAAWTIVMAYLAYTVWRLNEFQGILG